MAAVNIPGISTLEARFGYAAETTTGGVMPSSFTCLERCNSIGGIELPTENIDASALEDTLTKYIRGRQDTGGTWDVVFNYTDEVATQLTTMMQAYETARQNNKNMWFEVWSPYLTNGFYVVAQPPKVIPMPEIGQNSLLTVTMSFVIVDYKGALTGKKPAIPGE